MYTPLSRHYDADCPSSEPDPLEITTLSSGRKIVIVWLASIPICFVLWIRKLHQRFSRFDASGSFRGIVFGAPERREKNRGSRDAIPSTPLMQISPPSRLPGNANSRAAGQWAFAPQWTSSFQLIFSILVTVVSLRFRLGVVILKLRAITPAP